LSSTENTKKQAEKEKEYGYVGSTYFNLGLGQMDISARPILDMDMSARPRSNGYLRTVRPPIALKNI
jgi:hypothetical protein